MAELLELPPSAPYSHWMFRHPDGRRWIGYRAGTYIADQAILASGRSAADFFNTATEEILRMSGIAQKRRAMACSRQARDQHIMGARRMVDKVYSLRHLGFFSKHLITVTGEGFYFKGALYTGDDVTRLYVVDGNGGPRRMGVHLVDGKRILVNAGALELNGVKPKTGFFSGTNKVFEELRAYFEDLSG